MPSVRRANLTLAAILVGLLTTPPAEAYRGLASCPTLVPSEPPVVAPLSARRCARALATASHRLVDRILGAHAACYARVESGALVTGAPHPACLGLVRPSTGAYDAPTDTGTAAMIARAEAGFRSAVANGCTDADAAALGSCAATASGLAACVLAEQREHAFHVLDQTFGTVAPIADRAARRCHGGLAKAARAYVNQITRTHERCLREVDDGGRPVHRADQCLGTATAGSFVPPADAPTARRLQRAHARFAAAVARACPDPALGSLDACGTDAATAATCLDCVVRRESMLLVQGRRGGVADRPARHFIDWQGLSNPVLFDPARQIKNQAIAYADGWFWVVAPNRLRRTQDFRTYEDIPASGGRWFGDITRIAGTWWQTTNGSTGAEEFEIFARTSPNLVDWTPLVSITAGLFPNTIIDGALQARAGHVFLAFKDRVAQVPYITRSTTGTIDGTWLPPQRAYAGSADVFDGFSEAFHFLEIDGVQRIVGTGRDVEPFRCTANPIYFVYTCHHEPFIYTISDPTDDLATWTTWHHKTHLRIPYESWNSVMHANSAQVTDWRAYDGFFYVNYAGADDGDSFDLRGHGKTGLARSRDLVHWRVAGDLRD